MKKTWGIVSVVLIILAITAGRLYIKSEKKKAQQEQQISQEEAQQLIENQRQAKIDAQLEEEARKRDSVYQIEKAAREKQMEELRKIREELQKEIDAENAK